MPNVGFGELFVIVVVALLVFGPDKLPKMMRSFGQGMRSFQEQSRRAMDELNSATDRGVSPTPLAQTLRTGDDRLEDT